MVVVMMDGNNKHVGGGDGLHNAVLVVEVCYTQQESNMSTIRIKLLVFNVSCFFFTILCTEVKTL